MDVSDSSYYEEEIPHEESGGTGCVKAAQRPKLLKKPKPPENPGSRFRRTAPVDVTGVQDDDAQKEDEEDNARSMVRMAMEELRRDVRFDKLLEARMPYLIHKHKTRMSNKTKYVLTLESGVIGEAQIVAATRSGSVTCRDFSGSFLVQMDRDRFSLINNGDDKTEVCLIKYTRTGTNDEDRMCEMSYFEYGCQRYVGHAVREDAFGERRAVKSLKNYKLWDQDKEEAVAVMKESSTCILVDIFPEIPSYIAFFVGICAFVRRRG